MRLPAADAACLTLLALCFSDRDDVCHQHLTRFHLPVDAGGVRCSRASLQATCSPPPDALTAAVVAEGSVPMLGCFCFAGLEAKSIPQTNLRVINSPVYLAISVALRVLVIFFDLPVSLRLPGKDNPFLRSLIPVLVRCLQTDGLTHIALLSVPFLSFFVFSFFSPQSSPLQYL